MPIPQCELTNHQGPRSNIHQRLDNAERQPNNNGSRQRSRRVQWGHTSSARYKERYRSVTTQVRPSTPTGRRLHPVRQYHILRSKHTVHTWSVNQGVRLLPQRNNNFRPQETTTRHSPNTHRNHTTRRRARYANRRSFRHKVLKFRLDSLRQRGQRTSPRQSSYQVLISPRPQMSNGQRQVHTREQGRNQQNYTPYHQQYNVTQTNC